MINLIDCLESHYNVRLPVMHASTQLKFEEIIQGVKKILPKHCKVLDEDLAFFFYGRPSYRVSPNARGFPGSGLGHCVFILDSSILKDIAHIYPFDTGASQYYSSVFPDDVGINYFCLGKDISVCNDVIGTYWQSRMDYYNFDTDKIKSNYTAHASDSLNKTYINLLLGVALSGIDERRGTIEVSTAAPVPLDPMKIVGIIGPKTIEQNKEIKAWRNANPKLIVKTYYYNGAAISQYHKLIEFLTLEILKEKDLL